MKKHSQSKHNINTDQDGRNLRDCIYRNRYKDASATPLLGSVSILLRWKQSVFKLVWIRLLVYIVSYYLLSGIYHLVLVNYPVAKDKFEVFCKYCRTFDSLITICFLTGFYVSSVVNRWWTQFMSLPWPDQLALKLVAFMPGKSPFAKNLRRTVMRYVNLSNILVLRQVSKKVEKRFPTINHLVEHKLLLEHEAQRLEKVDLKTPHESSWTPLLWAVKLITLAKNKENLEFEPPSFSNLQSAFDKFEDSNRKILNYGWVNFPFAYTQVASMIVSLYFMAMLFARQFFEDGDKVHSVYVPIFTFIEFICFMGWIKVAQALLNPFGDDDEDFELNFIIDRNVEVSYLIVDEAEEELEMCKDPFLEAGIDVPKLTPAPSVGNVSVASTASRLNDAMGNVKSMVKKSLLNRNVNTSKTGPAAAADVTASEAKLDKKDVVVDCDRALGDHTTLRNRNSSADEVIVALIDNQTQVNTVHHILEDEKTSKPISLNPSFSSLDPKGLGDEDDLHANDAPLQRSFMNPTFVLHEPENTEENVSRNSSTLNIVTDRTTSVA